MPGLTKFLQVFVQIPRINAFGGVFDLVVGQLVNSFIIILATNGFRIVSSMINIINIEVRIVYDNSLIKTIILDSR